MTYADSQGQTLGQSAYDQLRKMILSGELAADTPMQEKPLAARLGVSRTPVREAISRLMSDGLVSRVAGGTPVVKSLSITDFIEILHVRRLLECEAARQAASVHSPAEPLMALRKRLIEFLDGERPSAAIHSEFDEALHVRIAQIAGSRLLAELIQNLKTKTRMFDQGEIPDRFEPGCHEHIEIIDSVLARDPERAEAAMRVHIDNAREAIFSHINRLY